MPQPSLCTPLKIDRLDLPNRIIMAPMTRMRAGPGNVPNSLNAEYYAQRASAGMIITEGTAISPEAQGYPHAPGIYTKEQITGWKQVTSAVHSRGGRILMQIAHNGRNSHSSFMPDGGPPFAPSAVPSNLLALTSDFQQAPIEVPRPFTMEQLLGTVRDFRQAAINAIESGFDGVEIQAANGHLIEQFLDDGTNRRVDEYGGSVQQRARFLLDVVDAVQGALRPYAVGVRLSPFGQYGGISDHNPLALFSFVTEALSDRRISYLHLIEARASEIGLSDDLHENASNNTHLFRSKFKGALISAGAYSTTLASQAIEAGYTDAIAFGRNFIANPDLVDRISRKLPLNTYDRSTFYGGDAHGYTDYPFFSDEDRDRDKRPELIADAM